MLLFACGGKTRTEPGNAGGQGGAGQDGAPVELCGATVCAAGLVCCSPSCGLCVEANAPCPAIGCTTTSGTGVTSGSSGPTSGTTVGPTTTTATTSGGTGGGMSTTTTGTGGAGGACG